MAILRAMLLIVGVLVSGTAFAAQKCYETVPVEASFQCDKNTSQSADFTSGCTYVAPTTKQVEVECPGRWVNVTQSTKGSSTQPPTQAAVCSAAGLSSAKIGGMFCASGERRPMVGGDFALINYKYGKKGDGNGFKGGNDLDRIKDTRCIGKDCDSSVTTYSDYCYDSNSGKKNNTPEDAVVAYFCE